MDAAAVEARIDGDGDSGGDTDDDDDTSETIPLSSILRGHDSADGADAAADASSKYIIDSLKEIYSKHIVGAERRYHLHSNFCLPTDGEIGESEWDAAPMVLLIGQYSTGKTSFLTHLLGDDFPGMHIGPEPTTDKFTALFYADDDARGSSEGEELGPIFHKDKEANKCDDGSTRSAFSKDVRAHGRVVKGNTMTVTPGLPFSSLSQFGSAFLNHFIGSCSNTPLLKRLTFIDTPGVLSGEKQRINRTYDFARVAKWFADRSDLILLLFDAHKLDISDELKQVIDTIRQHNDDKIRCVLNKADCVTREQLVRVYGSLMWSMGKIFHSPEVVRVYTGSFWDGALVNKDFEKMFANDEKLLVRELLDLSRCSAEKRVNQIVNRVRLVKVHVCILGTLRRMTPLWFRKEGSRERLLNDIESIMDSVRVEYGLSKGDMPNPQEFARCLENFPDFCVFPSIDKRLIRRLDSILEHDIPKIVDDANIVANELRHDQKSMAKNIEDCGESLGSVEYYRSTPQKTWKRGYNVLNLLGKVILICFLLLCVAEGLFYWSFSKPAYSLADLFAGYKKMKIAKINAHELSKDELINDNEPPKDEL